MGKARTSPRRCVSSVAVPLSREWRSLRPIESYLIAADGEHRPGWRVFLHHLPAKTPVADKSKIIPIAPFWKQAATSGKAGA